MLKTKPIKSPRTPEDGLRISIMSRHTLADGVTPDTDIRQDLYDRWWPDLAPSPDLIGDYYKRGLTWDEFENRYREQIGQPEVAAKIGELMFLASSQTVTLLCVEDAPEKCHRRLLAEECLRLNPGLEVRLH